jgi:hypothetical protein
MNGSKTNIRGRIESELERVIVSRGDSSTIRECVSENRPGMYDGLYSTLVTYFLYLTGILLLGISLALGTKVPGRYLDSVCRWKLGIRRSWNDLFKRQ